MLELNFECVRDVLKYLSDFLGYNDDNTRIEINWLQIINDEELRKSYDAHTIMYTLEKLKEICFINVSHFNKLPKGRIMLFVIDDITWAGHNFLQNIENDTIWSKVKEMLKPLGGTAWTAMSAVGIECATSYLKSKLGMR